MLNFSANLGDYFMNQIRFSLSRGGVLESITQHFYHAKQHFFSMFDMCF